MTFTSISAFLLVCARKRLGILGPASIVSIGGLCCFPRFINPLGTFDDAAVRRAPPEPFARLLRRDKLVLVKPATYVVAFGRSLKSNFTLIIRRVETCAHNIETERPELIAKVKDLAIDDI